MSTQFKEAASIYKAGLREQALRTGLDLGKDAFESGSGPDSFFHKDTLSRWILPSPAVLTAFGEEDPGRVWLPWLFVGANLQSLMQAASVDAALGYATRTHDALEEAGVPALNAKVISEKLERMVKADTEQERQRLYDDVIEAIVDSARRMDMAAQNQDKKWAFGFGATFCAILAYAALRQGATINTYQFWLFRVVAAVAAAGVAATIPGFINVNMNIGTRFAIRAGGALAVFLIIYQLNPPDLVRASTPKATSPTPSATSSTPHSTP
jgi:hypothetical protein